MRRLLGIDLIPSILMFFGEKAFFPPLPRLHMYFLYLQRRMLSWLSDRIGEKHDGGGKLIPRMRQTPKHVVIFCPNLTGRDRILVTADTTDHTVGLWARRRAYVQSRCSLSSKMFYRSAAPPGKSQWKIGSGDRSNPGWKKGEARVPFSLD
jgi:hypothetical protein